MACGTLASGIFPGGCFYTVCGPASMYPVRDPRRTAGPPYSYRYDFAWDTIQVDVAPNPSLTNCGMKVSLVSNLSWHKEIKFWNYLQFGPVGNSIGTTPGLQLSRTIMKGGCDPTGVHTIVLCKAMNFNVMTGLYSFDPDDFWDLWGGYDVTFTWLQDNSGSGFWGAQTPNPTYPIVLVPDGTLMEQTAGPIPTQFSVAIGGAAFAINDPNDIPTLGLDRDKAVPAQLLPSAPADFTLVREINHPEVFVVYGGAKFHITDPPTLFTLGFNWDLVHLIPPPGGTNQLSSISFDGTLLKEQHDPKVYLTWNQQLSWVTSPTRLSSRCLAWRNVRTVPDGALMALPRGPNI